MNTDKIYAESILKDYVVKTDSKVGMLKRLDQKVKRPVNIFAYTFGIISTLIFGTGLCLSMKVIGDTTFWFIFGIFIGVIGLVLMSINYLIYKKLLKNRKKKYSFEILTLAKEIIEEK